MYHVVDKLVEMGENSPELSVQLKRKCYHSIFIRSLIKPGVKKRELSQEIICENITTQIISNNFST